MTLSYCCVYMLNVPAVERDARRSPLHRKCSYDIQYIIYILVYSILLCTAVYLVDAHHFGAACQVTHHLLRLGAQVNDVRGPSSRTRSRARRAVHGRRPACSPSRRASTEQAADAAARRGGRGALLLPRRGEWRLGLGIHHLLATRSLRASRLRSAPRSARTSSRGSRASSAQPPQRKLA